MDTSILAQYAPDLLHGFAMTIVLSATILALATPLALALALMRESRVRALSLPAAVYVNIFRLMPALLVLFFAFYALPQLGLRLSPFAAAIAGLTAVSTAYLSEDIRGSIAAVDPGQYRAAKALGLGYGHTIGRIILPQALPIVIGPYVTRAILIVKSTAMASLVAVSELTGEAVRATSITYMPFDFLLIAGALYLLLNGVLALLQSWAERRVRRLRRSGPMRPIAA
jgi:His/Glu/Gln/Arg/opine family amino acid ABC transporter permease subunit